MNKTEMIEQLSDAEHDSWSRWMRYLFNRSEETEYGVTIPQDLVDRWKRQADTPYIALSEQEKDSDRAEVSKILPVINEYAKEREKTARYLILSRIMNWTLDVLGEFATELSSDTIGTPSGRVDKGGGS